MSRSIFVTHLYLDRAAKSALVAHHTEDVARRYSLSDLRSDLIFALSGCAAGDTANAEALLKDKISNAILDSMDHDWSSDMGAEAVMEALFNFTEGENQ